MADVENIVIKRLHVLYGPPNHIPQNQLPAFMREYHESLSGYTDDVLRQAMDWVRDNQDDRWWPTPGAIRKAAQTFVPVSQVTGVGWNDVDWEPKSEVSRANVRRMKEEFHRNMAAQSLGEIMKEVKMPDVSRPAMEKNERRWRQAERIESAHQVAKRMTGDRDD